MTTRAKTLTTKNLITLFGVTAMTVYNWKKGLTSKERMPDAATPAAVKRWALRNAVPMSCEPSTLLGCDRLKPGPKPRVDPQPARTR